MVRTRHVIRYYCDFCPRGYFKKASMMRHEKGCTANPNRVCGLCDYAIPSLKQKPMEDLIACLSCEDDDLDSAMKKPARRPRIPRYITAIRQSGIVKNHYDSEYGPPDLKFDFKKELQSWWAAADEAKARIYASERLDNGDMRQLWCWRRDG